MYILMKSALSVNWSSVIPIPSSSSNKLGSISSSVRPLGFGVDATAEPAWKFAGGMIDCGACVGADDLRCPNGLSAPNRLCDLAEGACSCGAFALEADFAGMENGLVLVLRSAFFSRSSIFFLNCLASLSSANDSPARQSSSSNVWKYMRSWLYENES